MENNWHYSPLSELTEKDSPITYGVVQPGPESNSGVAFIRGGDILNGKILEKQLRTISLEISETYKRTLLKGGELVISLVGNPGQVAIVPPHLAGANIARQVGLIRLSDTIEKRFIKYYLMSPLGKESIFARSLGSVQQVINLSDLRTVQVPLPPLHTQKAIAHILGALDDKIELLRSMNETLEAMARALFKSWFVDFDPVRRKEEGKPTGLPPEMDSLFPDSFEDSELGEIPKGWKITTINAIAKKVGMGPFGSNLLVSTFVKSGVPVISGKHLSGILLNDSSFNYVTESHAERLKNSIVQRGDLVFTHAGTIGQVSLIPDNSRYSEYLLSQRQFYLRCDESKISSLYMIYYFSSPEGQYRLLANASQVGVPSISRPVTNLRSIPLTMPLIAIANQFASQVRLYHNKIETNNEEIAHLSKIRDSLLPRLISGDLELSDDMISKILEKPT